MAKAIIFDLGNVIVNVDWTNFYKELATNSNKSVQYVKSYHENSSTRKSFERGELKPKEFFSKLTNELNSDITFTNFKNFYCDIFTLNKDVEKLIKKLKQNFRLILLSNTDALHFEYIKKRFKIINIFDDCILSYKVGYRKPNPLIFLSAIRKLKTMPFNCVYIDDIPEFVYMAKLFGIKAFKYQNFKKLIGDLKKIDVLNNQKNTKI